MPTGRKTRLSACTVRAKHGGLDDSEFVSFKLGERQQVTGNTHLYRFKLDDPGESINLPIARVFKVYQPGSSIPRSKDQKIDTLYQIFQSLS